MREMKGLKWGVLVGSVMVVLAAGLRWKMGISAFSPYFLSRTLIFWLAVLIAGVVAGGVAENSGWRRNLAGVLCAIPVTATIGGINALGFRMDLDLLLLVWIAAIIAGLVARRRGTLAGILCTVPAMAVYWYEAELSKVKTLILPGTVSLDMELTTMGLGAVGGLIICAIRA
jgi:hypothetical protein